MADPDAEITITAGGKTYTVFYGNRAFRKIERELAKPIIELNEQSLGDLTIAMWGGLTIHHPELTLDDVDEIIDEIGYEKMGEIVQAALRKALPEGAGQDPNLNRATRRAATRNGIGRAS